MSKTSIMGASGFIGRRYCELYPNETTPEPRNNVVSTEDDVLLLRSTTHNYHPKHGDLDIDIDTNLKHLARILPNVRGRLAFTSSWFVYANGQPGPQGFRETDLGRPVGWYSATKACAEQLIEGYQKMVGRPYQILRLCSVIGNDPRAGKEKGAIEMMIQRVVRGDDIDLYTGDCYRSVLHVDDVCRAIHLVLTSGPDDAIVNIGPVRSVRVYDLIHHAMAITKSKSRINLVAPPRFHQICQVDSFHMDTTKLRVLGFVPDMDAYQAVERVIARMTA